MTITISTRVAWIMLAVLVAAVIGGISYDLGRNSYHKPYNGYSYSGGSNNGYKSSSHN